MVANETSNAQNTSQSLQPSADFHILNAPLKSGQTREHTQLEVELLLVPELHPGKNADGTTVHYDSATIGPRKSGALFNPENPSVTFLVDAHTEQVEKVDLFLFDTDDAALPSARVAMQKIAEWHEPGTGEPIGQFLVVLEGAVVRPGMAYGFNVEAVNSQHSNGSATRWAGDPYSKAIVPPCYLSLEENTIDSILSPVNVIPQKSKVISIQEQDGVVSFPGVDGLEPIQRIGLQQAAQGKRVFYEMHVQDTGNIPASLLEEHLQGSQGTVRALQSAVVIERLKALGVTHLELLPCQAAFSEWFLQAEGARNVWGYMPASFHALHGDYFQAQEPHAQIREMIETINVLHSNGIAVILDWVSGHTHEGDNGHDVEFPVEGRGPSDFLRPFAEQLYYQTNADGTYRHDSGCGNTIGGNTQLARNLLLSSRDWYLQTIGFDGLRVDQASLLGRGRDGLFYPDHGFLKEFSTRPAGREDALLIAEPNDVGPEAIPFFNGQFPYREPGSAVGWDSEWSFRMRNMNRDVAAGYGRLHFENEEPLPDAQARVIAGSADIYGEAGFGINRGITATAFHDGLTTYDAAQEIVAARFEGIGDELREGIRAGFGASHSVRFMMRVAAERLTKMAQVNGQELDHEALRSELTKRLAISLLANNIFKPGDILLNKGDEDLRSQHGNDNAYKNPECLGLNWEHSREREIVSGMLQLRSTLGVFDSPYCLQSTDTVQWYDRAGRVRQESTDWGQMDDAFIATLYRHTAKELDTPDSAVLVVRGEGQYLLPEVPYGWNWVRLFDSNRDGPFEHAILGKTEHDDPTRQIATLYGPAGVAVYQLIQSKSSAETQ